jgi:hypothetical protein
MAWVTPGGRRRLRQPDEDIMTQKNWGFKSNCMARGCLFVRYAGMIP